MMSVRIVPKNYDESAKACISERFIASEDGFSFVNSHYDFGYPKGYKIPEQVYVNVYGEVDGKSRYRLSDEWGGSCYGMSLTSQMFFNNIWKYDSFKGNIDKSANSVFGLCKQVLKKTHALTSLIEHAQVSWALTSRTRGELYYDTNRNVGALVNELKNAKRDKYVMQVTPDGFGGHAVVPLGVIDEGGGNYKIRLYDVNNPGEERFASCNTTTNSFSYDGYACAALIDIEQMLAGCPQLETFPSLVLNGSKARNAVYETKNTILLKDCSSYSITDENGKDIKTSDDVNEIIPIDGNDCISYELPDGNYKIHANEVSNNTKIVVLNSEKSIQYSFSNSGVIDVVFDKDKMLSSSMHFEDSKKHEVGIYTYDKNKHEQNEKRTGKEFYITGRKNTFSITNS